MELKVGLMNDSFPPTIDGVANTVLSYADAIQRNHGEAVVITPKYPNVTDKYPFEVYRYHSINTEKLVGYRAGNPFSPVTISELRDKKLDLLHVHCPFASAVLARQICSVRSARIPMIFTYHTKFDIDIANRVKLKKIRKIATKLVVSNIRKMDEVWVVSEGAAQNLRSLGYTGEYRVMRNGTDFKKGLAPQSEIDEISRVYKLSDNELVFLFVGRMMWYKNLRLIIDTVKILKDRGLCFRMIFVGDGNDRAAAEQYAESIGVGDRTVFAGAVYNREKLRAFFSRSDLFVFPSTYDTSGLVVIEAAACSCPSVLVRGSCASEGVEDQFSGFMCEENAESCAETVINAVNDLNRLKKIGQNAAEHVYLSWDDAVAAAYNRYEEIARNYRRPKPIWRRILHI